MESQPKSDTKLFDYLRAISIIAIVFYHYVLEITRFRIRPVAGTLQKNLDALTVYNGNDLLSGFSNFFVAIFSQGWQFVGVFLFLSGFGLTYSRLNKGESTNFFLKRIKKLVPLWQIAIIIAFVFNYLGKHFFQTNLVSQMSTSLSDYLWVILFPLVVDFNFTHLSAVNPSLWFIVLVFQIYLFYDLFFRLLQRVGPYHFIYIALFITILYRYFVIFHLHGSPTSVDGQGRSAVLLNMLPARFYEVALGMIFAALWDKLDIRNKIDGKIFVGGLILFIVGNLAIGSVTGWIISDILLTTSLVFLYIYILKNLRSIRLAKILSLTAISSYFIFLTHNQIITQLITPLMLHYGQQTNSPSQAFLLGLIATMLTVVIMTAIYLATYKMRFVLFPKRILTNHLQ